MNLTHREAVGEIYHTDALSHLIQQNAEDISLSAFVLLKLPLIHQPHQSSLFLFIYKSRLCH